MMTKRFPMLLSTVLLVHGPALFAQSAVHMRIMPPNQAQFLQFQKFELRLDAAPFADHRAHGDVIDAVRPRAKNVILLIGDGMGAALRTAARVLSKGYTQGKANGVMAMDSLPFNGLVMTSSMDSLITDSAPGAHSYATGNKTNNGMEGVFP
ncbi:MAG: alkaline phosphatase [Thermoanaerobaculia bacterium]